MKIGFSLPDIGPIGTAEAVMKVAQRAGALGYSSLSTIERLLRRPADRTTLTRMPTYTGPSPTQFAVTSKSTVLEVIPPVWT